MHDLAGGSNHQARCRRQKLSSYGPKGLPMDETFKERWQRTEACKTLEPVNWGSSVMDGGAMIVTLLENKHPQRVSKHCIPEAIPPPDESTFNSIDYSLVNFKQIWRANRTCVQKPRRGEERGERLSPSFEASWLITPRGRCRAQIISWH